MNEAQTQTSRPAEPRRPFRTLSTHGSKVIDSVVDFSNLLGLVREQQRAGIVRSQQHCRAIPLPVLAKATTHLVARAS